MSEPRFLPTIQLGRAVAALMVVYSHCGEMLAKYGGDLRISDAPAAGVDIFFVISGFVIYLVYHRGSRRPGAFIAKRLARVGPPYWLYTTLTAVLLLAAPGLYREEHFAPAFALFSYLFVLSRNSTGDPGVLLGVGWTLTFEMYFYALMALAMLVSRRNPLWIVGGIIVAGAIGSAFVTPPDFARVVFSALPLEFLAGCLIAVAYLAGRRLPAALGGALVIAGFALIFYAGPAGLVDKAVFSATRVPWFGIGAAAIVSGLVAIDGRVRIPAPLILIGDASYSLYLCHYFVVQALGRIWAATGLIGIVNPWVLGGATLVIAVLAGIAAYLLVERPVLRWITFRAGLRRLPRPEPA